MVFGRAWSLARLRRVAFPAVEGLVRRRLKADQGGLGIGGVYGAVHFGRGHVGKLAFVNRRVDVSLADGNAAFKHDEYVCRAVVKVLRKLFARLEDRVVQGNVLRARRRADEVTGVALAHLEGGRLLGRE